MQTYRHCAELIYLAALTALQEAAILDATKPITEGIVTVQRPIEE